MSEARRIAGQMRQVMVGPAWHGSSVLEALDGVSLTAALAHPIPEAHSIWELVLHIDFTQRLLMQRLTGKNPHVSDEDFFPPVTDTSGGALLADIARLKSQEADLCEAVSWLSDDQLTAPITPSGSTVYETFHGHAHHNAFHAGQIRLLRKLIGA
jgi:hypothetical protein